jgi:hypothetical protein
MAPRVAARLSVRGRRALIMIGRVAGAKIRMRSFADILDEVGEQTFESDELARPLPGASQPGWWSSLSAAEAESEPAPDAGAKAAYDVDEEPVLPELEVIDEAQIAAELDLATTRTVADLARARRHFASHNHPDLFHPRLRAMANARMQLANMLIDCRRKEIEAKR